jgi:YidC/Oxa1 family membrane protein insertase
LRGIIKAPERELAPGERLLDEFAIFIGPTKLDLLKSFDMGFEKTFSGGFWGLFRMWLLVLLGFFYNVFHNYGVAIIALTITIKILFIPLTHKSFSSMKKMQELQPKMKALQEQFRSEPQKLNKEVMELYKKHKVNPLGGCFPLLLQMPIFIALYQVLSEAVELRGAPFCLWIKDLAEADKLVSFSFTIPLVNISSLNILPILMMFSMVWQQKLTGSTGQTKEQQNMMLMMPVVFVFIFYNLPSGLVLYWLLNNILTIAHQLLSHRLHPATTEIA